MDIISLIVSAVAIYGLLNRAPSLIADALAEREYAARGEQSPAAADRRQRLLNAGIDPATGGALRQYLGNVWRDFWLDQEAGRVAARARRHTPGADGGATGDSWWAQLADRLDEEVTRRADRWRTRPDVPGRRPNPGAAGNPGTGDHTPGGSEPPRPDPDPHRPFDYEPGDLDPDPHDPPEDIVHDSDEYTFPGGATPGPRFGPGGYGGSFPPFGAGDPFDPFVRRPEQPARRPPIRVSATLGDPIREPAAPTAAAVLEGAPMSNALAQRAVTGVVSGSAEARAIQRQVDAATAEYVRQLGQVRARIHALGEQTLGTVQMATYSQVVGFTANAAESAAAAQHAAQSCSAEVGPLMGQVARAFDRINS